MLIVHNTNLVYIQYKNLIYFNVMWWPQLYMYITVNIYEFVGSSKLSLFGAVCGSPCLCKRKIEIYYQISYL